MKKLIIVIVLLLLGGAVAAFALTRDSDTAEDTAGTPADTRDTRPSDADMPVDEGDEAAPGMADAVTVVYTNAGFVPNTYRLVRGGEVTIENRSSDPLDFASDDHPVHTDNTELNAGTIEPGDSVTITLDTAGTWGFHNHENASHTGTIIVQ